jgi:hypothetical protein
MDFEIGSIVSTSLFTHPEILETDPVYDQKMFKYLFQAEPSQINVRPKMDLVNHKNSQFSERL